MMQCLWEVRYSLLLEYWKTELREEATEVQNLEVIQTQIVMQNNLKTVEA